MFMFSTIFIVAGSVFFSGIVLAEPSFDANCWNRKVLDLQNLSQSNNNFLSTLWEPQNKLD